MLQRLLHASFEPEHGQKHHMPVSACWMYQCMNFMWKQTGTSHPQGTSMAEPYLLSEGASAM